ncbi:arylsulfatase [Haladaptatus sp. QDMS2]|uniref:arylsulfatase n=1 Tax=Haladaptatus sp. QDMS2 TaxID=3033391 RepID=UPI0023E806A7|nr:arylsulfatase [Haladaptatus sp. QDMS2]
MPDRPNILLLMTDQQRGDTIGADPATPHDGAGEPVVHTPNLNHLAATGTLFSRAYTPAPSSIPARRCLWTGQTPATNGCPNWTTEPWSFANTLPELLTAAGYQTRLTGKTHSLPQRNHFGFEHIVLHAGLAGEADDYSAWLDRQTGGNSSETAHGIGRNSWDPRPWHLDESLHPTTWTTNRALEFFEKRDPTRPFFHTVSYVRPHQPFDAPQPYWDMYADRNLPGPYRGDWAERVYGGYVPDHPKPSAWCADLPATVEQRARAGYYGSITHVDHQINRLLRDLEVRGELQNTVVVFFSDHGDMLGDHLLWRKTYAYEGSARVPLILRFPESMATSQRRFVEEPVGLEDVMPTLLSAAGADIPPSVEGRDLGALSTDPDAPWREFYHGEHGPIYHDDNAMHYLVDATTKYVWNPVTGEELLFDLAEDPGEEIDLSTQPENAETLERWRSRLVSRLEDRPEGFSDGTSLEQVSDPASL